MASTILRYLLLMDIVILAGVALFYLSRKKMDVSEYIAWGLLALVLPLLGPFLVIILRPGEWRQKSAPDGRARPGRVRLFALLGPPRSKDPRLTPTQRKPTS